MQNVDVFAKNILVQSVVLELADIVDWPKLGCEVGVFVLLGTWQGSRTNLIGASPTKTGA